MRTIILDEPGRLRLTATAPPLPPGPGQALVQVRRVGICGTDLHAYRGRQPFFSYPRILGHELGVQVLALGPDLPESGLAVGDICAVEPYLNCGECGACRRGKSNCCERLQVLGVHVDGGMREQILVPAHKLHKAQGASLEQLALVEMLCIGAHAVRRAGPVPGEHVLVVGAGPIGAGVVTFARLAGARVTVLEMSEERMRFAREVLQAEAVVDARQDVLAQLRGVDAMELPTTVFDATGNVRSMENAFGYVANGGKLVLVGLVQEQISFFDPEFHRREMTLLSSRNATGQDFRHVIDALDRGAVHVDPWITHMATPETLVDEFPHWLDPESGVVKAMLTFGD